MKQAIVSVRMPEDLVNSLQAAANVNGCSVGELIRQAAAQHISNLGKDEGFKKKAREWQESRKRIIGVLIGSR